ncbi:hypothetical protein VNO78_04583 [Psophocarpus tetragonolobus]|uniref:Uncharacterized protein n=1 Tax=Psophocarpus tetragonolobus TaxID=3891 RepID=A0AAN9XXK3_PSOTE
MEEESGKKKKKKEKRVLIKKTLKRKARNKGFPRASSPNKRTKEPIPVPLPPNRTHPLPHLALTCAPAYPAHPLFFPSLVLSQIRSTARAPIGIQFPVLGA